jgi:hypothetical protein
MVGANSQVVRKWEIKAEVYIQYAATGSLVSLGVGPDVVLPKFCQAAFSETRKQNGSDTAEENIQTSV